MKKLIKNIFNVKRESILLMAPNFPNNIGKSILDKKIFGPTFSKEFVAETIKIYSPN